NKLVIATHEYHDLHGRLPAAALYDGAGKALLSWRVQVLPHLGHKELYQQFKRDEPWDSEHNKKLLASMPDVFAPVFGPQQAPGHTFYQAFTGPGTIFEGRQGIRITDIFDGTSVTILLVEAGEAVPRTKPADLP